MTLLAICLAGAVGSGARYPAAAAAARWLGTEFPYGTLLVNIVGSFLIGLVQVIAFTSRAIPETLRVTLTAGLLGGFTTYSAFAYESLALAEHGARDRAIANVVLTTAACLLACALGMLVARVAMGWC